MVKLDFRYGATKIEAHSIMLDFVSINPMDCEMRLGVRFHNRGNWVQLGVLNIDYSHAVRLSFDDIREQAAEQIQDMLNNQFIKTH